MKNYTNKNPEFSDSIQIMETTDTNHAENVNVTTRQLMDNTLALKEKQDEFDQTFGGSEAYTTEDKEKLAGIEEGANKTVVDTELSAESENPVQNRTVKAALDAKGAPVHIGMTAPSDPSALWVKTDFEV